MDPLSVLGATAAAAQLLEQGMRLTKALYQLYAKTRDAPELVQKQIAQIEQLIDLASLIIQNPSLQKDSVASVLSTCLKSAYEFQEVLRRISATEDDGKFEKTRKAFSAVMKEKDIARFFDDVERGKSSLILCIQAIDSNLLYTVNLKVDGVVDGVGKLAIGMNQISGNIATLPDIARDVQEILQFTLKRRPTTKEAARKSKQDRNVKSYYLVPNRRVRGFIGREDILSRIQAGFESAIEPRVVVIRAMGGQGKTQVALEYCYRAKEKQFQAIFWADATSENTLKKSFETTAERIKAPGQVLGEEAAVDYLIEKLIEWPEPWLMVLDNYDDPVSFNNLQEYIPDTEHGYILITTRHTDTDSLADPRNAVELPGLGQRDAVDLLLKLSQIKETDRIVEEARHIVDRLGYHPLAITQAGSYIKLRKIQLDEFMTHYKRQKKAILQQTPQMTAYRRKLNNAEKETALNVFTTWELSFQQLEAREETGDLESDILTLFAFFDCKDISEQLFKAFSKSSNLPEKSSGAPGHSLGFFLDDRGDWASEKFVDVLIDLTSTSLLQTWSRDPDGCHFSIHPLVKDWILMRTEATAFAQYCLMGSLILSNFLEVHDNYNDFTFPLSTRQTMMSHLDVYLENKELLKPEATDKNILDSFHESEFWFARLLFRGGRQEEAEVMSRRVLEKRESMFGPDDQRTLDVLDDRSAHLSWFEKYTEAIESDRRMINGYTKLYGHNHTDTFKGFNNLFVDLIDLKTYDEARQVYDQYLKPYQIEFGLDHNESITSINNCGYLFEEIGKLKDAEDLYAQSFELGTKALGVSHSETLISLENYVRILSLQSKHEKAAEMRQMLAVQMKLQLGPDHPQLLENEYELAWSLHLQKHDKDAEFKLRELLERERRVFGPEHSETLKTLRSLALVLNSDKSGYKEAEDITRTLVETQSRLTESGSSDTRSALLDLANILMEQERFEESSEVHKKIIRINDTANAHSVEAYLAWYRMAEMLNIAKRHAEALSAYQYCLAGETKLLTLDNPSTLSTLMNVGITEYYQDTPGNFTRAEEIFRQVYEGRSKVLGPDKPETLSALAWICDMERREERFPEAEIDYGQLAERRKLVLGPEHDDTLSSLAWYGDMLLHNKKFAESQARYHEVFEKRISSLGLDHSDTLNALFWYIDALFQDEKFQEAERELPNLIQRRSHTLGPEHNDTLSSRLLFGKVLMGQKRFALAEQEFRSVLSIRTRTLGREDDNTIAALTWVEDVLDKQDENEERVTIWQELYELYLKKFGPGDARTYGALSWKASVLASDKLKRYSEAEVIYRELILERGKYMGEDNPATLAAISSLDSTLEKQEHNSEREPVLRDLLARQRRSLGSGHADTLSTLASLGTVLRLAVKYEDAIVVYKELVQINEEQLGLSHRTTLSNLDWIGVLLRWNQQHAESEHVFKTSIERATLEYGAGDETTLATVRYLAYTMEFWKPTGKFAEAALLYTRYLDGMRKLHPEGHPNIAKVEQEFEVCQQGLKSSESGLNMPSTVVPDAGHIT